jgi:hypothetical protein
MGTPTLVYTSGLTISSVMTVRSILQGGPPQKQRPHMPHKHAQKEGKGDAATEVCPPAVAACAPVCVCVCVYVYRCTCCTQGIRLMNPPVCMTGSFRNMPGSPQHTSVAHIRRAARVYAYASMHARVRVSFSVSLSLWRT